MRLGLKQTWSGAKPILTSYIEWLQKKTEEHIGRIDQLDDEENLYPVKKRAAAYILLDERIIKAKVRFTSLELLEEQNAEPDMIPIILRHLSHVACLFGHNKKDVQMPTFDDPASISLFEPAPSLSTIDLVISSVVDAAKCPARLHTYLPPCTHRRPLPSSINRPVHVPLPVLDVSFFSGLSEYLLLSQSLRKNHFQATMR